MALINPIFTPPCVALPSFHLQTFPSVTNISTPPHCLSRESSRRADYTPSIWDFDFLRSLKSDYQAGFISTRTHCLRGAPVLLPKEDSRGRANYTPSIWDYHFVQLLRSDYQDELYVNRAEKLKEEIKCLLQEKVDPLAQLELIDDIQRLGVGHIFYGEIKEALQAIWVGNQKIWELEENDLHATSLRFRLLREHGYHVSQDVFNKFKDTKGSFMASLSKNIKGTLSLYEASHFAHQGETVMVECRAFTSKYLEDLREINVEKRKSNKLEHALELPIHWRMQRVEALWYLNRNESEEHNNNPTLFELAKLDFNMTQATHQRDLKKASRWWKNLGVQEKLRFSRDRLLESFFVAMGVVFEPKFEYARVELAKVCQLITTIDDVYDTFGSLDELKCFTTAVERWDIKSMELLPEYMQICFLALYNTTNEMAYEILKDQGFNITTYLHKAWTDLCKAMLVEAEWYHSGHKPTLQEYLNNGWISSSGPVILTHAFLLAKEKIPRAMLDDLENYPNLIRWPSMIFRLCNDLATYKGEQKRGEEAPSSITCFMQEANVSEIDAQKHIGDMIFDTWTKLNEEVNFSSPYPFHFINFAFNLARVTHCIYQHGDGHSVQDHKAKNRITSLLIQPIPLS